MVPRPSTYFLTGGLRYVVPTDEEFIDGTMEGLPTHGSGAWVRRPIRLRKAVMEGRNPSHLAHTLIRLAPHRIGSDREPKERPVRPSKAVEEVQWVALRMPRS